MTFNRRSLVASSVGAALLLSFGCTDDDDGVSYATDVKPLFERRCVLCHHEDSGLDLVDPFRPEVGMIAVENTWFELHGGLQYNIVPFDPEESFILQKVSDRELVPGGCDPDAVEGDDCPNEHLGIFMPPRPPPMVEAQIETVRQWIAAGAEDGDLLRTSVAPILGTKWNYRGDFCGRGGYAPACILCINCHFSGARTSPNLEIPNFEDTALTSDQRDAAVAEWLAGIVDVNALYRPDLKLIDTETPDASFLLMKLQASTPSTALGAPMPYGYEPLDEAQIATLRQWIVEGANNN
jgi:hypothetical protein